jgi:hypothetical protein
MEIKPATKRQASLRSITAAAPTRDQSVDADQAARDGHAAS